MTSMPFCQNMFEFKDTGADKRFNEGRRVVFLHKCNVFTSFHRKKLKGQASQTDMKAALGRTHQYVLRCKRQLLDKFIIT